MEPVDVRNYNLEKYRLTNQIARTDPKNGSSFVVVSSGIFGYEIEIRRIVPHNTCTPVNFALSSM